MTKLQKALLVALGLTGSTLVSASNASLNLTNDVINGDATLNLGNFALSGGGTYDEDTNSSIAYVGIGVEDAEPNGPLQAGIGIRGSVIDTDTEDDENKLAAAVGIGGWYRYTLPQANRLSIYGSGYYSPEILTLTELAHTYTYEFRGEYMTMRNARAYVRYGKTVVVFDDGSHKDINAGISVGATVDF